MTRFIVLSVLLLAGCSPAAGGQGSDGTAGPRGPKGDRGERGEQGPPGDQGPPGQGASTGQNGSRIHVVTSTWKADDGLDFTFGLGFFDTEKGVTCSFSMAEDGQVRCMPQAASVAYSDANCSVGMAFFAGTCPSDVPPYVGQYIPVNGCSYTIRARSIGAEVKPVSVWNPDANGTCTASQPIATFKYFDASIVVPPSEFVAGTLTTDP